ncbi:hypothetical protein COCON_G00203060 [Conger conger]|uniref:Uncharacterized protein n=1 Tax=Conger conger TaxID=82655 RepID=A0A9Q1CZ49_CONCO|nr:hypothetical protein COCON_G00203060 [Conger conger]
MLVRCLSSSKMATVHLRIGDLVWYHSTAPIGIHGRIYLPHFLLSLPGTPACFFCMYVEQGRLQDQGST